MRLRRLNLTRYGKFTDGCVDFGEHAPGEADLHLIYGPNEAGKSTLFAAWLDLLYGIPPRSPYNFLHEHKTMRIGAAVDLVGSVRDFIRVKRPQNSLLDGAGQPVAEGAILAELGGIDRESYRTMFSLDDDTLEQGGEAILQARGDLGQLLFSASSGLADLSGRIAGIRETADKFHRSLGRNTQLSEWLGDLERLKKEREAIDIQASRHADLVEAERGARARHDAVSARRTAVRARQDEIRALLQAAPGLVALRGLRDEIAPLEALPEAPAGWREDLAALREAEIQLATERRTTDQTLATLRAAEAAIPCDAAALALAGRFEALAARRAKDLGAAEDLPHRRQQLGELDFAITLLLRRIEREGEADPARLLLPAARVERLRDLIESRSGIETDCANAAMERAEAWARRDEAAEALGAAPAAADHDRHLAALEAALAEARGSDAVARRRLTARAGEEARAALEEALAALRPWQGQAEALTTLTVPDGATLQAWRQDQQAIAERIERWAAELERQQGECLRLTAQREAVGRVTGLATDAEAAAVRAARDQAWEAHRARLDAETADRFAERLRRDDETVARRFAHTADLARLHETVTALDLAQAGRSRAEELLAAARAEAAALAGRITAAIGALSPLLPTDWSLSQLEAWLVRRETALAARERLRAAERDQRQADGEGAAVADGLASALAALGRGVSGRADLPALIAAADAARAEAAELRLRRKTWDERRQEAGSRDRALARAEAARQAWDAAWAEACAGCWLGEGGAVPALATVRGILPVLAELAAAVKERAALAGRVEAMTRDRQDFAAAVIALARDLGLGAVETTPVAELDRAIGLRIRAAEDARQRREQESARLAEAETAARDLEGRIHAHALRKQERTDFFAVSSLAEVAIRLDALDRRAELRRQILALTRELLDTLRLDNLAAVEAALAEVDPAALRHEQEDLAAEAERLDRDWLDAGTAWREAEKQIAAIGGDARVAEIEARRRTILLEIEEGARRYLRLRAGAAATEQALRLYRDRHRSSMMARASEALSLISRGAYPHLTTQPEKEGEVLVAIAADGRSKLATEMSKGTRFQLYLALRVAGYFEFARNRHAVPFVADDIMETFDDFRAEETLRLFARMAGTGQVIYLTHHRHLCEIARAICPTVRVHDLSSI